MSGVNRSNRDCGGPAAVELLGRLTRQVPRGAAARGPDIVEGLAALEFIDSSGVAVLARARRDPMTTITEQPAAAVTGADRPRPRSGREIFRTAGVGCRHRGHLRLRRPAFRVLPQRVGQHGRDDVGPGPARRRRRRGQHGLYLGHDLRGAAVDTAARGGRGQPRLQRGGEHPARRRGPGHGGQLGDAVQLGVSTAEYVLYTLVSGIWNVFARLGLPVLALLVLVTASPARGRPDRRRGGGPGLARRPGRRARPADAQRVVRARRGPRAAARARARLPGGTPAGSVDLPGSLLGFRDRAGALIAARGWRITAATAASNLTLWLVLLACLRGIGLSQAQVPWQTSLAAFAFVRLLTVLPITPGGLGITELGLIAILAAGAGHRAGAQVTAAVLLYRAVTYLPPIPLGAIACLVWRHAPALIHAKPAGPGSPRNVNGGTGRIKHRGARKWPGRTGQPVVCRRAMATMNGQQVSVDRNRRSARPRSLPPWVSMTSQPSKAMNTAVTTAQP